MAKNIELFNQYAAHFLAQLYNSFPEPCLLDTVEAVKGQKLPEPISNKSLQTATTDPEIRFCCYALKWLYTTGYFTGNERLHCVQIDSAVLTPKGFEALNAIPDALQAKGPLGDRLSALAAEGSKEATSAVLSEVVGQVIGVASRHLFSS